MKPVIIFHPDEQNRAHLIDNDAVAALPLKSTGEPCVHYLTAVFIQDLNAGEFRVDLLGGGKLIGDKLKPSREVVSLLGCGMAQPSPAVYAAITQKEHRIVQPGHRGIEPQAAIVLLKLASSFNNIETRRSNKWTFNSPAVEVEDGEIPWSEWRFITAWLWSGWNARPKKPTLAERFSEMEALGYERGLKSFEAMHRQMFPKNSR